MSNARRPDPADRFRGLARLYARHRPPYPAAAVDAVVARCGLGLGSVLVDVGCGTGISSRAFAERGLRVIGLEPNDEMRRQAEAEPLGPGVPRPTYRTGRAEATGLPDGAADAILAAQAFHWFEPEAALREFHRILRQRGWAIILYNERDESDPFTASYSTIVRGFRDSNAIEASRVEASKALFMSPLFSGAIQLVFPNEQRLDEEGLVGRAFSASYAPREAAQADEYRAAIRRLFEEHQSKGRVTLRYTTTVSMAQRASGS